MARRTPPLEILVFTVGIATLGAEIAAARLMAPFFGASTIVWANTIAIVLVALSIGYWFGGRLADRHPHLRGLCLLILVAALLLALVPLVAEPFLSLSVQAFDTVDIGAFAGSLFGVLALVAIPVLMLGAVSPWAIRLKLTSVEDSGQTAGRMYAISTVGSLLGTFSASLLLIPLLGTQRTFLTFALLLTLVAVWGLGLRYALAPVAVALLMAVPIGTVKAAEGEGRVVDERDTEMQYDRVVEYPDGERHMELNEGQAIHSIYRPDTVLTGNVWDGYLIAPFAALRKPPGRIAILGFAGGTTARAYEKYFPETKIDGVEIDGELFDLARKWFGLNERPQLELHAEDARPFLRRTDHRYDAIFVDAYRQPYIPFYLTSEEFFELASERLNPGGVLIVNVGHPENSNRLEQVLSTTVGEVFPNVARDPITDTNTLLVASEAPVGADRLREVAGDLPFDLRPMAFDSAARMGPPLRGGEVYTDDHAPVEWLIDKSIIDYAGSGAE